MQYWWFLTYYGKGYCLSDVKSMPLDDLLWHVKKLNDTIMEEKRARDDQDRKMAAKSRAKR